MILSHCNKKSYKEGGAMPTPTDIVSVDEDKIRGYIRDR
jgi:hypothetical protein